MAINTAFDEGWSPDRTDGPEAGKYHVAIVAVKECGGRNNEMTVNYEVLAGTTPHQEGRIHRDYFAKTIKAMGRIHQLAIASGMITVAELKAMQEAGTPPSYEFERDAPGLQLMVELTKETFEGKERVKCGFGLYRLDDPKVASWPKNMAMIPPGFNIPESPKSTAEKSGEATSDMFRGVV